MDRVLHGCRLGIHVFISSHPISIYLGGRVKRVPKKERNNKIWGGCYWSHLFHQHVFWRRCQSKLKAREGPVVREKENQKVIEHGTKIMTKKVVETDQSKSILFIWWGRVLNGKKQRQARSRERKTVSCFSRKAFRSLSYMSFLFLVRNETPEKKKFSPGYRATWLCEMTATSPAVLSFSTSLFLGFYGMKTGPAAGPQKERKSKKKSVVAAGLFVVSLWFHLVDGPALFVVPCLSIVRERMCCPAGPCLSDGPATVYLHAGDGHYK